MSSTKIGALVSIFILCFGTTAFGRHQQRGKGYVYVANQASNNVSVEGGRLTVGAGNDVHSRKSIVPGN
jgi:hypothetical protein